MSLYSNITSVQIEHKPDVSGRFSRRLFEEAMKNEAYRKSMRMACAENTRSYCHYYSIVDECRDYRNFAYNVEEAWHGLLETISNLETIKEKQSECLHERLFFWEMDKGPLVIEMKRWIEMNREPGFVNDLINVICSSVFKDNKEIKSKLVKAYFDCLKVVGFKIKYKWVTRLITKEHGFSNNLKVTELVWTSIRPSEQKKRFEHLDKQLKELKEEMHALYVKKHVFSDANELKYTKKVEEETCAVCLEPLCHEISVGKKRKRSNNPEVTLACGHILHEACVLKLSSREFFKTSHPSSLGRCPLCRIEL